MKHYKAYLNQLNRLESGGFTFKALKQLQRLKRRVNRLKPQNTFQAIDKRRLLNEINRVYNLKDPSKL